MPGDYHHQASPTKRPRVLKKHLIRDSGTVDNAEAISPDSIYYPSLENGPTGLADPQLYMAELALEDFQPPPPLTTDPASPASSSWSLPRGSEVPNSPRDRPYGSPIINVPNTPHDMIGHLDAIWSCANEDQGGVILRKRSQETRIPDSPLESYGLHTSLDEPEPVNYASHTSEMGRRGFRSFFSALLEKDKERPREEERARSHHHSGIEIERPRWEMSRLVANDMWTGDTPPTLATLTLPERLLIALRFPRAYVVKLYLKGGRGTDHPLATQTQLKGNITMYHANVDAVKQMLDGQLMPRRTSILPSLIAVTFIGRSSLVKSRLKSLFRVRRKAIREALLVLKNVTKHPGYVNLNIDTQTVDSLPEDDVPEEIYAAVRWDQDESVVVQESAGYAPVDDETDDAYDKNDVSCLHANIRSAPDNGTAYNQDGTSVASDPDVVPLEYSGVAAADETQITPQELMRNALKKLAPDIQQHMFNEGAYIVRHGGFARDFGPATSTQDANGEEEPNPSVYAFPHLFPYGLGGLEAKRETPVSFTEHVRCLLQRHDTRFRKDPVFPFWALSLEQK